MILKVLKKSCCNFLIILVLIRYHLMQMVGILYTICEVVYWQLVQLTLLIQISYISIFKCIDIQYIHIYDTFFKLKSYIFFLATWKYFFHPFYKFVTYVTPIYTLIYSINKWISFIRLISTIKHYICILNVLTFDSFQILIPCKRNKYNEMSRT